MVERDGGGAVALFPLIFFNGERETHIGNISIHSTLDFKVFQSKVGQMIGISYNNITIYLVDSKKSKLSPDRRKILITGKVNFSQIVCERDCYFLVVLKRSRRARQQQRRPYQNDLMFNDYLPDSMNSPVPEKLLLLRRNQTDLNDLQVSGYSYNDRLYDLHMQRENYMNMLSNSNLNSNLNLNQNMYQNQNQNYDPFPTLEEIYAEKRRNLCRECSIAKKGDKSQFHHCVYDPVVAGFQSTAGAISRPVKEVENNRL